MSDIKIQATKPFTLRDAETGALTSIADGSVVTMDATLGNQLISDGLATEFTLITPTGKKNITDTSETDVTAYATAMRHNYECYKQSQRHHKHRPCGILEDC